ncbi:UDP-N-acetylglucosamine 2-epimerase [Christiangramia echinicola]|uniref:UDP-N-acetylglucosamine 2-epimerase n=1 Tax=Christiangramia echinicola TaxID=279359 RepID=UPI0004019317|nr:UDP-N-acetylglucosamine 2-epimerase [Christiangramia echinicola]
MKKFKVEKYLIAKIKKYVFRNSSILSINSEFGIKEFLDFIIRNISKFFSPSKIILNLLITSKTEVRVFLPLSKFLLNNPNFELNIIYLADARFEKTDENAFRNSSNINIIFHCLPILFSFDRRNHINLVCLDFEFYQREHSKGISLIRHIREKKGKTICIQHGGIQNDNAIGQSTSLSEYLIVYGSYMKNKLVSIGREQSKIFISGNPLHDEFFSKKSDSNLFEPNNKKNILLATCLHTEYGYRQDEKKSYSDYIQKIYSSIDFEKYNLIIKMHPYDDAIQNIYKIERNKLGIKSDSVKIFEANDYKFNTYKLIKDCHLLLSRSSTVIEEALIISKKVIAFDLYNDGPSKEYSILERYAHYKRVVGVNADLKSEIEKMINISDEFTLNTEIIEKVGFKLDGKSTERVVGIIEQISCFN